MGPLGVWGSSTESIEGLASEGFFRMKNTSLAGFSGVTEAEDWPVWGPRGPFCVSSTAGARAAR